MRLSCGELVAKEIVEKKFGWKLIVDRSANLTVPLKRTSGMSLLRSVRPRVVFTASYFNSPFSDSPRRRAHWQVQSGE